MRPAQLSAQHLLLQGCDRLGLALSEDQIRALILHLEHLSKWNQRFNLTSIQDKAQMAVLHTLDSLSVSSHIRGCRLLDIGSGGGFPGLPLAIAHPRLQTVLLDSHNKKAEYLGHVASQLALSNVTVMRERIENYQPMQHFDTITARAVGPLQQMADQVAAWCGKGSRLLVMKGKKPQAEIQAFCQKKVRSLSIVELQVPFLNAERNLVVIEF